MKSNMEITCDVKICEINDQHHDSINSNFTLSVSPVRTNVNTLQNLFPRTKQPSLPYKFIV
jgi:hypothetical protein